MNSIRKVQNQCEENHNVSYNLINEELYHVPSWKDD